MVEEGVFSMIFTVKREAVTYIGLPNPENDRHVDPTKLILWLEYKGVQALFHTSQRTRGYTPR